MWLGSLAGAGAGALIASVCRSSVPRSVRYGLEPLERELDATRRAAHETVAGGPRFPRCQLNIRNMHFLPCFVAVTHLSSMGLRGQACKAQDHPAALSIVLNSS